MSGTLIQERQTIFRLSGICSRRSALSTNPRLSVQPKGQQLELESEPSRLQSLEKKTSRRRSNSTTLSTHPVCTTIYSPSEQYATSDSKHGLHLAWGSGYFTRTHW